MKGVRPLPWKPWTQTQRDLGRRRRSLSVAWPLLCLRPHPLSPDSSVRTEHTAIHRTGLGPSQRLTLLGRADEVPDTPDAAIVLAFRLV